LKAAAAEEAETRRRTEEHALCFLSPVNSRPSSARGTAMDSGPSWCSFVIDANGLPNAFAFIRRSFCCFCVTSYLYWLLIVLSASFFFFDVFSSATVWSMQGGVSELFDYSEADLLGESLSVIFPFLRWRPANTLSPRDTPSSQISSLPTFQLEWAFRDFIPKTELELKHRIAACVIGANHAHLSSRSPKCLLASTDATFFWLFYSFWL
jgi:hypothetical protein